MDPQTPPSTPPSPTSPLPPHPTNPPSTTTTNNTLSDIFSTSPSTSPTLQPHFSEPSDYPRLRAKHTTEGYRDGITVAKARSLQPGVDEGWPLGATFALRVGYLLGVLEGLWEAYGRGRDRDRDARGGKHDGGEGEGERERVGLLVREARVELAVERIFGREWWKKDGVWRYEVEAEEVGGDVTFREVVGQHPVVRRWEGIVGVEVERAGIRLGVFEGDGWEAGRVGAGGGEGWGGMLKVINVSRYDSDRGA